MRRQRISAAQEAGAGVAVTSDVRLERAGAAGTGKKNNVQAQLSASKP